MGSSSRRSKVRRKSSVTLSGEAAYHVGADAALGNPCRRSSGSENGTWSELIASLHSGEDGIGSALQGDMKVAGESGLSRHEIDELLRHRCGLYGTEAQTFEPRNPENPPEKLRQGERRPGGRSSP